MAAKFMDFQITAASTELFYGEWHPELGPMCSAELSINLMSPSPGDAKLCSGTDRRSLGTRWSPGPRTTLMASYLIAGLRGLGMIAGTHCGAWA